MEELNEIMTKQKYENLIEQKKLKKERDIIYTCMYNKKSL
jgi:hypothetical protein